MALMNWILFSSFLLIQLPEATAEISWENCKNKVSDIRLLNLTVRPDPIIAPGSVSIAITIHTNQNLTSPLKATLSLKKKLLFIYIYIPCSTIGSCMYDDLCAICAECHCPMEAGEHILNLPLTIDSSSSMISGKYQVEINLETSSGQKGCVEMNNIDIKRKN